VFSGKRELFKEFVPSDPAGIIAMGPLAITPDGKYYAYPSDPSLRLPIE